MLQATLGGREGTSGLANVINTRVFPRNLRWVARRRERDWKAIEHEASVRQLNLAAKAAMDGIVLKLARHVF